MKKFVIIGIAVLLAGFTALAAMSKMATGSTTHVTTETIWFDSDHSTKIGEETKEYTIKNDGNESIKLNNGVLATITK